MKQALITISASILTDTAVYDNNYRSNNYDGRVTAKYPHSYSAGRTPVYHHYTYVSTSSNPSHTTMTRKKGWSSAAKGTAIGAASGAVLGAALSKDHHRAKGAVIGGAAGAAGGYLYGRHRDKKNGRY